MIWKNGTQGTKVTTINERKLTSREWEDAFTVFQQILFTATSLCSETFYSLCAYEDANDN